MKKKIVSALLCATMISSMLVGCGSSDAATTEGTATEEAATEKTTRKQRKNNEKLSRSYQNPPNYWQKMEKGNSLDDKQ